MTLTERYQWAYGFAVLVTSGAYFVWLAVQLGQSHADDINYVTPLLWTLLASFVVHSLGRGFAAHAARADRSTDARDREISRRADALSFFVFSVLAAGVLAMGLADLSTFWLTNALFLAFSLTAVFGVGARATFYRKGVLS